MTMLTNEEKIAMIDQHKKNIDYAMYGLKLDMLEIKATTPTDAEAIDSVQSRIDMLDAKLAALNEEAATLVE